MENQEENIVNTEKLTEEIDFGENSENVEMNVEQESEKISGNTDDELLNIGIEQDILQDTVAIEEKILENDTAAIEQNILENDTAAIEENIVENDTAAIEENIEENDTAAIEKEILEEDEPMDEPIFDAVQAAYEQETPEQNIAKKKPEQVIVPPKLVQLPLSKIKQIMKFDPDVSLISSEGLFLVTRATEMFVQSLAKEAYTHTAAAKKKTIQKKDLEAAIESVDTLNFLEGMMV